MMSGKEGERFDWEWLEGHDAVARDEHVVHVRLSAPMVIKVDGRSSHCAIIPGDEMARCLEVNTAPPGTGCCAPGCEGAGSPGQCAL